MIEIIENEKKTIPHYILEYNYVVDDDNGKTKGVSGLSINNPFIERYISLLNNLKPNHGHWAVILEKKHIEDNNLLIKDDYNFLLRTMFEENNDYFKTEEENKYADEFSYGVMFDIVFEGADLFYIDEYGNKKKTKFV